MRKRTICALPFLLLTSCGSPTTVESQPLGPDTPYLWSESLALAEVRQQLPFLTDRQLGIKLAVLPDEQALADVVSLVRDADAAGVRVSLWPMIRNEDGRYPGVKTHQKFRLWWNEIINLVVSEKLPVDTLVMDMELSIQDQATFQDGLASDPQTAVLDRLNEIDDARYEEAKSAFQAMVDDAHAQGLRVHLTTLPLVLDDFQDGDQTIQKALDCPIEGIDWDEVSFQIYRSMFNDLAKGIVEGFDGEFGNDLVYQYSKTIVEKFGDKARVDLGVIGWTEYKEPAKLLDDIGAAQAAGMDKRAMNIFALDTLVEQQDPAAWMDFQNVALGPPEPDPDVVALREKLQGLDSVFGL